MNKEKRVLESDVQKVLDETGAKSAAILLQAILVTKEFPWLGIRDTLSTAMERCGVDYTAFWKIKICILGFKEKGEEKTY